MYKDNSSKILNVIFYILLILTIICLGIFIKLSFFSDSNTETKENVPEEKESTDEIYSLIKINFINNGSKVSKSVLTCYNVSECTITIPDAKRTNGNVLGYSIYKNDTKASYLINNEYTFKEDTTLYAISYVSYTLSIDSSKTTYLAKSQVGCNAYNQSTSCTVTIPQYNVAGYETKGYSTSKNGTIGSIFPGESYTLTSNLKIYPVYKSDSRGKVIPVRTTKLLSKWIIDVDNNCPDNIASKYYTYFQTIASKAPFLALSSKITFLGDDLFDQVHGENYVGMTYGPTSLKLFDVRCGTKLNNDYYATIVHELTHVWDFYYGHKLGTELSSQTDIVSLYNKYENLENRPFRDYSYSNKYEFLADSIRYYYLKYIDPAYYYKDLDYPSDIKKVMEKYICIAKNNYETNKCK